MDEFDALLAQLGPEDLDKVNDIIDPENSYLPASDRCKQQTAKTETGPYDRTKLLEFLTEQGKNEKDWDHIKSYVPGEKKGKVWQAPPVVKPTQAEEDEFMVSTEWDDVLTNASESEIVELAAILGFTGLINQVQYHAALNEKGLPSHSGGWNAAARSEPLKILPPEPDNTTDVEDCIKKAKANDSGFTRININNIKEVKPDVLKELLNSLKDNTYVQTLEMANVGMTDSVGRVLAELLEANSTLKTVNAESNRLTGLVVSEIVRGTLKNQTLLELRLSNQRSQILGNRVEMEVADAIQKNDALLRLNLQFDTLGPRVRVTEKLKQNLDALDLRQQNDNDNRSQVDNLINNYNHHHKSHLNKEDLTDDNQKSPSSSTFQREKKYSSRKKVLDEIDTGDEPEKPLRRTHSSKSNNQTELSDTINHATQKMKTTTENYAEEASLCINEFDVKTETLVKVKELKNGAHMIRFVRIEEPSSSHGLDIKDICMLNCCVEKTCDLAMLSEQRTNDGFKCYLFACNGSCTYAPHGDYTSMILKKDSSSDDETTISNKQSKTNEKISDASSSTISTTCRSSEFSCRDGSCIPYYDVCNSYEDCPSGIDEAMCSPEFTAHQRTQQENRKKPSAVDIDSETNTDLDEVLDEIGDEESVTTKSTPIKTIAKNEKQNKNSTTSFLYNIDLDTQDRVSKLQKLKEYLEETKGPEAWYHLFQTLVQHQQQDHSNIEPEQIGSSSSNDEDNFQDHLLALEQQWIADRQKTTTTTTTTTMKPKFISRKTITTTTTTTKASRRMKINNENDPRLQRPSPIIDDEVTDDEEDEGGDDGDRYYWQPTYDDRRGNRYNNYPQKTKSTSTTRKPRIKYPSNNRDSTMTTLLRANGIEPDNYSHTRSFIRESSVILLLLLGLVFTIILLVLVGFYCRDSWKHGRIIKSRSTDADYLINGLYL
ncbi:unnamed protein product [Adineta steineri]|uniref:MANSC domain-containing protein n=1 Tax=Adineta steineri TaxID=433720 RepID=A0A813NRY0_9BILA|nr:unnamed protein product [Adineta steineri]CAF3581098.1 unnamed protein product [Adineta steineri]